MSLQKCTAETAENSNMMHVEHEFERLDMELCASAVG